MKKNSLRSLWIGALLIGLGTCASADTDWTLNATFTDGLTATGTFVTTGGSSSVAPTFVSWDITFAGGTLAHDFVDSSSNAPPGAIAVEFPPNASWPTGTLEELGFANEPGFDPYVDFFLSSYLTDAGGSMTFKGADSCDGTCYGLNVDQPHTLVGTAVPEPSAVIFLGTVVGILGATTLRRRKQVQ